MTTKKLGQRNFAVSKEIEEKLLQLRNYHNKTYNNLFEILVENAFLSMNEAINLTKGKELEEQNHRVGFQVQQLTLMFSELKKELAEVRTENHNLKEQIAKISDGLESEIEKNKERSGRYTARLDLLEKYNLNKDKSWLEKMRG